MTGSIGRSAGRGRRRLGRSTSGDRVGVVPQGGGAAAAVAEAGGGVAQVEAAGEELAGGVVPPAPDVELRRRRHLQAAELTAAHAWEGSSRLGLSWANERLAGLLPTG